VFGRDSQEPIPRGGLKRLGIVLFEGYPTGGEGEDMLHGAIMMVYERECVIGVDLWELQEVAFTSRLSDTIKCQLRG
jgi:hypothetical protein